MKLKQRFICLGILSVIVFFSKTIWLPHLQHYLHHRNPKHKDQIQESSIKAPTKKRSLAELAASWQLAATHKDQIQESTTKPPKKKTLAELWQLATSWIKYYEIYPKNVTEDLSELLYAMSTSKIIKADVLSKGTQLKLLLILEGEQKVVFKPKRFERDYIVPGNSWDGFDRHNAEVAGFHLDSILHFRRAPIVIGRKININSEILPVVTEKLNKTFIEINHKNCFYGVCYYCKQEDYVCPENDGFLEGSLTLWIEKPGYEFFKLVHPYQRTYSKNPNRIAKWQADKKYCNSLIKPVAPFKKGPRLLDITDGAIFDYIIGNGDRHHYEIFKKYNIDSMMIMIDNAKAFGNYSLSDKSILEPIKQCCAFRKTTVNILQKYKRNLGTVLDNSMKNDPIYPVLTNNHLNAVTNRVKDILDEIENCQSSYGGENILFDKWYVYKEN